MYSYKKLPTLLFFLFLIFNILEIKILSRYYISFFDKKKVYHLNLGGIMFSFLSYVINDF